MERSEILNVLILCNYYLTYRCNAFCNFCHFADHGQFKTSPMASYDDFARNIPQLAKLGVRFIDLTGGEPLLHPDIARMAGLARSYRMKTSITTNCLLYSKKAESLAGKVNLLHFSLDSPDRDEHDAIRGVRCFDKVIESIGIAQSLGEYPDLLFTVTNSTYPKLPRMYELARKYNIVLIVNPVFSYFGNEGLSDSAIDFIAGFASGRKNLYMNDSYLTLRRNGGNDVARPLCKAVSRVIVISPGNEIILPCYHFGNRKLTIDRPIKDMRKLDEALHFQKMEGRFEFCQGCTVNCYFEPSFAFPTNRYGLKSLPSKLKYIFIKTIQQRAHKLLRAKNTNKEL